MIERDAQTSIAIELDRVGVLAGDKWLVRSLSLRIKTGETFVLVGPSGCGKTTTLRVINRLIDPVEGSVFLHGTDAANVDPPTLRRGIGYVIQDSGLFSHYTVRRNVGIMLELMGWPAQQVRERVGQLLETVGLPAQEFSERYPSQLSGGQRQRVGIARALATDPPVVLLDEPFSSLDPATRYRLQTEFLGLSARLNKTFVFVTHDMLEAVRLADRIGVLCSGALVQCGPPEQIVRQPANETVASLLGPYRYQLGLMTTDLRESFAQRGTTEKRDDARAVLLDADASLWDAVDRLERERADCVGLIDPPETAPRYLSRADLFAVMEQRCG